MSPQCPTGTVPQQVLARLAADPQRIVLSDRERSLTGSELHDLIGALTSGLSARGLSADDVVAIIPTGSVEAVAVRYAAALLGCATAYCPAGSPAKADAFVREVGATTVVVMPETSGAARLVRHRLPVLQVSDLLLSATHEPPTAVDPDSLGWLVSSGGTTGSPKASRRSFSDWARCVAGPSATARRQLICTSLVHVAQVLLDQTLVGGGTVVLRDQGTQGGIDAVDVLETIETERITHVCLVEPQLVQLVDDHGLLWRDLSSLVAITHIGADAAPSLRLRLLRRLESVGLRHVLAHTYGASELGVVSALAGADYSTERPELLSTAGRVLPGIQVTIQRPDGSSAEIGEDGRIVASTPGAACGATGSDDIGHLDNEGYLHVRGRAEDARGTTHLFPVDIQDALCAHPHVRYAVAVPSPAGFNALVVPMPGHYVSTTDLRTFARRHLGGRLPLDDLVVGCDLLLTEQGKPDRAAIGALFSTHPHVA